ncbi:hypothetical protein Nepgr_020825 [Nepenthes gracilis]|uniref:NEDD8 ultimate buster 1 n=1 Tax=Nepenthes gracilis TaxID=150966 RepID=A0AAD3SXM4_NEPGR|nr:hypothetical protein Nepgr_020825 [Nepenthes gracilis]
MAKLKLAGTWSGVLEVELESWTVPRLREEVARRSNFPPDSINLIFAGRVLRDGDGNQKLGELGVKNNAKILASRINADEGKSLKEELMAEEQRSSRLSRLKAAATALAKRHSDGSLPLEDFNIELEDQNGKKVSLGSETDQRAIMMGLMLHAKGKQLIRSEQYKDALEVLAMGENAFSLCDSKVLERIDNAPILQIDMVWCYFMLRDISLLSVAGVRLAKAREGIERAHGKDASRVRLLQRGLTPEVALYLRLELLEGVVAYHNGQFEKSRESLTSAQTKLCKLQVSDEALSLLMSMGYKEHESKRALKMNSQDVESAINFLVEERERKSKKHAEDIQRRNEIMEQKQYGKTALGKAVDLHRVNELVSIGFARELAAEALRRNENDTEKALDDLTNPELNSKIQLDIESRKRKREHQRAEAIIAELESMGYERSKVVAAVNAHGTRSGALNQLLADPQENAAPSSGSLPQGAPSSSVDADGVNEGQPNTHEAEERDVATEKELAEELDGGDSISDYDINVTKEADAVNEYLSLLESACINET